MNIHFYKCDKLLLICMILTLIGISDKSGMYELYLCLFQILTLKIVHMSLTNEIKA